MQIIFPIMLTGSTPGAPQSSAATSHPDLIQILEALIVGQLIYVLSFYLC